MANEANIDLVHIAREPTKIPALYSDKGPPLQGSHRQKKLREQNSHPSSVTTTLTGGFFNQLGNRERKTKQ